MPLVTAQNHRGCCQGLRSSNCIDDPGPNHFILPTSPDRHPSTDSPWVSDGLLHEGEPTMPVAMNIIHLHRDDLWLDHNTVMIRDRRCQHICAVLRASVGDTVRVGLLGGAQGEGRIEEIDDSAVRLHVRLDQSPPVRHRFDIVLALPRPKMLRRVFRTVAEFGVANLHLINSARVEKSYWQSPLLKPAKVAEALQAGMERSRDTVALWCISTSCFALC